MAKKTEGKKAGDAAPQPVKRKSAARKSAATKPGAAGATASAKAKTKSRVAKSASAAPAPAASSPHTSPPAARRPVEPPPAAVPLRGSTPSALSAALQAASETANSHRQSTKSKTTGAAADQPLSPFSFANEPPKPGIWLKPTPMQMPDKNARPKLYPPPLDPSRAFSPADMPVHPKPDYSKLPPGVYTDGRVTMDEATYKALQAEKTREKTLEEATETIALRERQLAAIQRVGEKLMGSTSVEEIMHETLEAAIDVLDGDVGSVQIYDAITDSLIFRKVHDPDPSLKGYSVPISRGIDGRVYCTGIPDVTNSVKGRRDWNSSVDDLTGHVTDSLLSVPLKQPGSDPIGVIQILNGKRPFDLYDMNVLEVLCAQATQALINAQLHEEAQRRLDHLRSLRNVDIAITSSLDLRVTLEVFVDQVITQLHLDAANVLILNQEMLTLEYAAGHGFRSEALRHTQLRLGEGLAGRAALERRTVHLPNLNEDLNELQRSPHLRDENFKVYFAVPLIAKGQIKGVLEAFHRDPIVPGDEWMGFLETLAGQAAIAMDNAELFDGLQRTNIELALAYDTTIEGWSCALDLRDKETEGHTLRVTELTLRLAREMGISEAELVHVRRGALLHDIGKMGIPDAILLKPGPLSDEEWVIMRKHPVYALDLLSRIPYLRSSLDVPYYHHEKWDGSGYPTGLCGEQIPLAARIFAVADVWDALRSDRPYRPGWEEERAREYIISEAGKHFDPQVVEVFQRVDLTHLDKTHFPLPLNT
jgi:putative nucleotidyltransferase with HDIG domain